MTLSIVKKGKISKLDSATESFSTKRKFEDEVDEISLKPSKKRNASNHKFIKPPNPDEIRKFREVQFLHHSNMFRLQMNELLSALEVKQKTKVRINAWVSSLSGFVKHLEKSKTYQLTNLNWLQEVGLKLPLRTFSDWPKTNGTFTFLPPHGVTMVGSFPLSLANTHSPVVDVALILPKELVHSNDAFSGRWLLKRALYLAWIGKALAENTDIASSVSWTRHCGSPLRPLLQVTPEGKLGKTWKVLLHVIPHEESIRPGAFSSLKNNVLPSWFLGRQLSKDESPAPTPHYNWLCGVDVLMMNHHRFIETHLKQRNFVEGLQFLKIWLNQRNLNQGEGGVSGHLMTMLVITLLMHRKISSQMSPYQVFRTGLLYLTETDWRREGARVSLEPPEPYDRNHIPPSLEELRPLYPVVFVDHTGFLNLAAGVTEATYLELRHEAKIGLEILELSSGNSFDALFIHRMHFNAAYDQTFQIRFDQNMLTEIKETSRSKYDKLFVDRLGDIRLPIFDTVLSTMTQGLGDRIHLIGAYRGDTPTWNYGVDPPELEVTLTLGLSLSPRNYTGLLTKGPSADTAEAAAFRDFWGELSSLRRFRDSTFHEAVLWMDTGNPIGDRRSIPAKIVTSILGQHFKVERWKIRFVDRQLEDVLRLPYSYHGNESFKYGTGEEATSEVILAMDSLSRKLRSIELPLSISQIQSTSDVLGQCCVYPPMSMAMPKMLKSTEAGSGETWMHVTLPGHYKKCPLYTRSVEVQLFLEISGKWPDDLLAIQAIKAEFMCKMAELLRQEGVTAVVTPSHMFLIWEGYVFRVCVCYRREIFLLRSPTESQVDSSSGHDTDASIQLEKEIEIIPKITSSLNSLQSDFPSFSGGVRLVRRWVSSQLLLGHFPHLVVDLLVTHLYQCPFPHRPPATPHVALLRFLQLMAYTDWHSTPILINFREQFNANDETELTNRFTDQRGSWPPLFVCTPYELRPLVGEGEPTQEQLSRRYKLASCWSRQNPTVPILARMKAVAEAALETYTENVWKEDFDFTVLLRPPLEDYDVILVLKEEEEIARRLEHLGKKRLVTMRRYERIKGEKLPPVDFDPVQLYLKELNSSFGNHALFFNDEHGGNVIGVVWKPSVYEEKEPKMASLEGHRLVGVKEVKMVVNTESILEEFRILGQGLVEEIRLKDS